MKIHRVIQMLGATTSTGKLADDMYALGHKDYYSEAEDKYIPISHMDFQHMVRAFVKQNDDLLFWDDTQEGKSAELVTQNQDLVNANKNLGNRIDVILKENEEVHLETQRLVQQLEHDEHQVGKYDDLTKVNAELRFQIEQVDRNQTVSKEAYDIAWDNNKALKKQVAHWKKLAEDNFISSVNDSETSGTWKNRYEKEVEKSDFWHRAYVERCTSSTGHNYVFSEIPNDCDGQQFTDSLKKYLNKDTYKMRVRGQYLKDEVKENGGWRKYERGQPIEQSKCLRVYLDKK